jgi:hypothetical protein
MRCFYSSYESGVRQNRFRSGMPIRGSRDGTIDPLSEHMAVFSDENISCIKTKSANLAQDPILSVANYHLRSGWKLKEASTMRFPASTAIVTRRR